MLREHEEFGPDEFVPLFEGDLGLDYEVASVSENAKIGPAPLAFPNLGCVNPTLPDCAVMLDDRDVILETQVPERLLGHEPQRPRLWRTPGGTGWPPPRPATWGPGSAPLA